MAADKQSGKHTGASIPRDGRKGAPDGVNSQIWGEGPGDGAPYPNPHTGKADADKDNVGGGFLGHGGQSGMGYHGEGQLGDRKVTPGGNRNSGAAEK